MWASPWARISSRCRDGERPGRRRRTATSQPRPRDVGAAAPDSPGKCIAARPSDRALRPPAGRHRPGRGTDGQAAFRPGAGCLGRAADRWPRDRHRRRGWWARRLDDRCRITRAARDRRRRVGDQCVDEDHRRRGEPRSGRSYDLRPAARPRPAHPGPGPATPRQRRDGPAHRHQDHAAASGPPPPDPDRGDRRARCPDRATVATAAPQLLNLFGVGPDTAGQLLTTAGDNPNACSPKPTSRTCGVAPIPASSARRPGPLAQHLRRPDPQPGRDRPHRRPRRVVHSVPVPRTLALCLVVILASHAVSAAPRASRSSTSPSQPSRRPRWRDRPSLC